MIKECYRNRVVVRGAGEMASGVIKRFFLSGFEVIALEQAFPNCVRRKVCYAEAVAEKEVTVEKVTAVLADSAEAALKMMAEKRVAVLIDPNAESLSRLKPLALVDGRMLKKQIDTKPDMAPIVVGLGPGFTTGENCHAAVETNQGPNLGQVIYDGSPQADTGVPAPVEGVGLDRVLRSPADGSFHALRKIGDLIAPGEIFGEVAGDRVASRIGGIIRGLIRDGLTVAAGQKIGDVDPRGISEHCFRMSGKANRIGQGALEAVQILRARLS